MFKQKRHWTAESDCADDPASLPPDQIVTSQQLTMRPGQKIRDKARELGCSLPTLKLWTAEWRGSGYDPDYVIRRAGHDNWLRAKWQDRDWCEALRLQITKKQHRHVGDLLLELGLTTSTAQYWTQKHVEFADLLWSAPRPKNHFPTFCAYVRYSTIDEYRSARPLTSRVA